MSLNRETGAARQFKEWFSGAPAEHRIQITHLQADGTWHTRGFAANAAAMDNAARHALSAPNAFVRMTTTRPPHPARNRRGGADLAGWVPGVWADIDFGPTHATENLPVDEAEALELVGLVPWRPTMTMRTGAGLHVYWRFREPSLIGDRDDVLAAQLRSKRFADALHAAAAERGWHVDTVGDLSRVLRVCGSRRVKAGQAPNDVVPMPGPSEIPMADRHITQADVDEWTTETLARLAPPKLAPPVRQRPASMPSDDRSPLDLLRSVDTRALLADAPFGPWEYSGSESSDRGSLEWWLRSGSANYCSLKRDVDGAFLVWSSPVCAHLGVADGSEGLSPAQFLARLHRVSESDIAKDIMRAWRKGEQPSMGFLGAAVDEALRQWGRPPVEDVFGSSAPKSAPRSSPASSPPPAPPSAPQAPTAPQYVDESGELLFTTTGGRLSDGSARRVPYRLPAVLQAVADEAPVYLVATEAEADALTRLGVCATAMPGRPETVHLAASEIRKALHGATRVVVIASPDTDGIEWFQRAWYALQAEGKADAVPSMVMEARWTS